MRGIKITAVSADTHCSVTTLTPTRPRLHSTTTLRSVIATGSLLVAMVIAVAPPVAVAVDGYSKTRESLEAVARVNAAELARDGRAPAGLAPAGLAAAGLANAEATWLAHARSLAHAAVDITRWRLLAADGRVLAEHGAEPGWWPVSRGAPVPGATAAAPGGVTSDARPARIELDADVSRLLTETLATAALCALIGAAVGWGTRRNAMRLLDAMLEEQGGQSLRFHTAINNISQGLCFFDGQSRLIVCNSRYAQMYGLTDDMVRPGTSLQAIVEHRFSTGNCPEMTQAEYLEWRSAIAVSNVASDTVTTLRDGRVYAIHHQPMPDGGWVATHDDITERKRAVAQIERMAHHDALTGLPNKGLFRDRLNQAVQRSRGGAPLAVLYLDLDRFKIVNDTLGHPVGDELLRATAQRLCECLRQSDMVARLGGDEFAILQADAPQPAAAQSLAERLVRVLAMPFEIDGHQVVVGASVGVAFSPEHGIDPDELLKKADLAMYNAKAAGRGVASFFNTRMDEQVQGRRKLELDLRRAIEVGEFVLHFQPIVSLPERTLVGFEALLRWQHPQRGMVAPDSFMPLAEETGLIAPLGEWVLREAFAQAAQWPSHLSVAVNVSPLQLRGGHFVPLLRNALQAAGLAPTRVEVEITESVLLAANSINLATLHELRSLGVRISLDDFGVGFSSLSYLRSFPFKKIKIDRSFVRDVVGSREAAAIVGAITTLGANLDMIITAEGVECEEQLVRVHQLGCDEAQGYLISAPRPAAELEALWRPGARLALVGSGNVRVL